MSLILRRLSAEQACGDWQACRWLKWLSESCPLPLQAKKRVYELQQAARSTGTGKNSKRKRVVSEDIADASASNEAVEVVPVLEPLPKWELVREIVQVNIRLPCQEKHSIGDNSLPSSAPCLQWRMRQESCFTGDSRRAQTTGQIGHRS